MLSSADAYAEQYETFQYQRSINLNAEMLNEYDLINEYRRIFWKIANKYREKLPSMEENGLHYLNEYTRLIGTWE